MRTRNVGGSRNGVANSATDRRAGPENGTTSTPHIVPAAGTSPVRRYLFTCRSTHEERNSDVWPDPSSVSNRDVGMILEVLTASW